MFMMPGNTPAFIDWQYTAVGKGCQDILFFLVEGYSVEESRRLEPVVMAHYHSSLVHCGVRDYSFEDLKRDWKLACMHFPLYVAMWFGTTPDEDLVDPGFPRRFVPRAFDAIIRNCAHELLPSFAAKTPPKARPQPRAQSQRLHRPLKTTVEPPPALCSATLPHPHPAPQPKLSAGSHAPYARDGRRHRRNWTLARPFPKTSPAARLF